MKTLIKLLFVIIGVTIISNVSYVVFDYFLNASVILYLAIAVTLFVAYKGIKADLTKKDHHKEKNNAF